MMHSNQALYDELRKTLIHIDEQISNLKEQAKELEVPWLAVTRPDGTRPATQLLVARSHCLSAMAALKVAKP